VLGRWPSAVCAFDVFVNVCTFCSKQVSGQERCCQSLTIAILLRKQVGGFAEHVYAKSHWSRRPSPVRCSNVPGMQFVCVCEGLVAHTD